MPAAQSAERVVRKHPRPQTTVRESSEISCCLKYVIFGSNVVFWVSASLTSSIVLLLSFTLDPKLMKLEILPLLVPHFGSDISHFLLLVDIWPQHTGHWYLGLE